MTEGVRARNASQNGDRTLQKLPVLGVRGRGDTPSPQTPRHFSVCRLLTERLPFKRGSLRDWWFCWLTRARVSGEERRSREGPREEKSEKQRFSTFLLPRLVKRRLWERDNLVPRARVTLVRRNGKRLPFFSFSDRWSR